MDEPPAALVVQETEHWLVNHCVDSTLPGYLIVSSLHPGAERLADLPTLARVELGEILARLDEALSAVLSPTRVYFARWGHTPGHAVHFHVIPVFPWLVEAARADARYRGLLRLHGAREDDGGDSLDGPDLTLYVVREYQERDTPPPVEMPSVEETTQRLRKHLG